MKATGIVRRIDDLGRIVIPKEIRQNLKIKEGDPLELYTTKDGEIVFKKYSPFDSTTYNKIAEALNIIIPNVGYAIYDSNGEISHRSTNELPLKYNNNGFEMKTSNGYCIGYLCIKDVLCLQVDVNKILKIIKAFISD